MSSISLLFASFMLVTGVTFIAGLALLRWLPTVRGDRLAPPQGADGVSILRFREEPATGLVATIAGIGRAVEPKAEKERARYRRQLAWAGYHDPNALVLLIGTKVALALLLGSAYVVYGLAIGRVLQNVVPVTLILAVVGFFVPDFWLHNRIKARRREILHALPNVLDLLMVCVEAGMGFDAAVARVAERPETRANPLHQELMRMHLEVRAGRPRSEALRAFGERTGVQEVRSVVGAFVQAEKLGTPIGKTLRIHADAARVQRRHRAEELAHLAPLKMIFPTVFFLFPSYILVTMAPSVLSVMRMLEAMRSH